eukprot:SAG31_NODE_4301_length_3371_cov_6.804095_1_plen_153_part_00
MSTVSRTPIQQMHDVQLQLYKYRPARGRHAKCVHESSDGTPRTRRGAARSWAGRRPSGCSAPAGMEPGGDGVAEHCGPLCHRRACDKLMPPGHRLRGHGAEHCERLFRQAPAARSLGRRLAAGGSYYQLLELYREDCYFLDFVGLFLLSLPY